MHNNTSKLEKKKQAACEKDGITFSVILGKDELESCKVRFEYMRMKGRHQGGSTIDRKDMVLE